MQRLSRILSFDVSPMRPSAFQHEPLFDFIEAEDFQRAWHEGVQDAQAEHDARQRQRSA